ncbi:MULTISPECIES: isoprenylcysteine carboxylmethyltransferase family protein [unclassified Cellulomonas]|uniref:methyltransferase family protein n=1 Tax=unclassified Cellulomonas TaxID=2620175 RepID=UPI001AEFECC8|nr:MULTISPECIES: isoprenylcysteine carboxylmethyltransferase family protein [unclassified Cellulomonas]MBW0254439.1 isoprenylcysteine carboxylmethyltransferase family protein [Cellulomonas sp. PS-H5]MCG7284667.1 isoprenylcysteine carboxylmethyltransferase family protein [Cellulomonas sp. ACRRI]
MSRRVGTAMPPVAFAAVAGAVQLAVSRGRRPTPGSLAAAALPAATAAWLLGDALVRFRRARTTVDPLAPAGASTLVTTGANRVSRNPMYLGMAAALLAHAVALRSPAALAPVAGFVAVLTAGQITAEEDALDERFGESYARYCAEVPRWADLRSVRVVAATGSMKIR